MTDFVQRFWSFVDIRDQRECWKWTGTIGTASGYGMPDSALQVAFGEPTAHRIACALAHPRLDGCDTVLHSCDNTLCCNPRHLRWGTQSENRRDRYLADWARGALEARVAGFSIPTRIGTEALIDSADRRAVSVVPLGAGRRKRLNPELVKAILADYAAGMTPKELAAKHGITHSHADHIVARRIWKDVA